MQKLFLLFLLNLPLFSNSLFEVLNQKLSGKSFLSIGAVQQISNNYNNSQALQLNYAFIHQNHFGIDVGYTQSLGEAQHKTINKSKDFSSISILPTYLFAFDKRMGLKAKIGYAKNKSVQDGLSYGAELIFQTTHTTGLSISYQQMNENMKYLTINYIYKLN